MSHGEPDFLFEAVANSLEAGANRIVIDYKRYQEFVDITVTDDGEGFSCDVFFIILKRDIGISSPSMMNVPLKIL